MSIETGGPNPRLPAAGAPAEVPSAPDVSSWSPAGQAAIPPSFSADSLSVRAAARGTLPASGNVLGQSGAAAIPDSSQTALAPPAPSAPPVDKQPKSTWQRIKDGVSNFSQSLSNAQPSVWGLLLGSLAGFVIFGGLVLLTGGMAALAAAMFVGIMGAAAGALTVARLSNPDGDIGDTQSTGASEDADPRPPSSNPATPPATPDTGQQWLQQLDRLVSASQEARRREEAEEFQHRMTSELYRLQEAMAQTQADAARRQEYSEYSRRYVLVNKAREDLQRRFTLP